VPATERGEEPKAVTASLESLPIVGVELGARMESTALSVVERAYVPRFPGEYFNKVTYDAHHRRERLVASEKVMPQYRVRHLESGPRRSATRGLQSA
jgi:hypothetical protein